MYVSPCPTYPPAAKPSQNLWTISSADRSPQLKWISPSYPHSSTTTGLPHLLSHSALQMREEFAAFDAERLFDVPGVRVADPKACQCGEVLKGVIKPWECKVFGTACTPETPIGTCMVSSEGACAAYYNFGRFTRERVHEATRV